MKMDNVNNASEKLVDPFAADAALLIEVTEQLARQLQAVKKEGKWTLGQKCAIWHRSLGYRLAILRLRRVQRKAGDPNSISIPSRFIGVYVAVPKEDVESALDSLEVRGEFTSCVVPHISKAQRRTLYKKAKKRGFMVRTESRYDGLLIERVN